MKTTSQDITSHQASNVVPRRVVTNMKGAYTPSVKLSDFTVTSYLTEKLSKLRSFHTQ
jgi:hypothetical protein